MPRSPLRLIAGVGLALAAAGLVAATIPADWVPGLVHTTVASGATPLAIRVAGETLTIPAGHLRFRTDRHAGEDPRVELLLTWPGLTAPGDDDPVRATTARDGRLVFITIAARETELDSAERIATIYQTFLEGPELPGPDGLIKRLFRSGSSYEGEELYFEPGAVRPFAARCYRPQKGEPVLTCLRDVRMGRHLMATIRFPVAALGDWRRLRDGIDAMLADMSGEARAGG